MVHNLKYIVISYYIAIICPRFHLLKTTDNGYINIKFHVFIIPKPYFGS